MNRKTFLKGAAILGIAGIIVQILGAFFRIPLANIIGDEGMGYYQTAYPIYICLLVFSTNGAPAAISKMTAEKIAVGNTSEAHRIFQVSFILLAGIGIVTSLAVFLGAMPIVSYLGNVGAYYSMMAIAPALLFAPIMSVYRGYFQGYQDMGPTASSQIVEQIVRVGVGLILAVVLVSVSIQYAAAGAVAGGSIGPVFGTAFLIWLYRKRKIRMEIGRVQPAHDRSETKAILKKLASIAIPITIGVSIWPMMNLMDLLFVMRRLQDVGFTVEASNALYGQLSGLAGPIINIPQALALSIALSLVPAISASKSAGDIAFLKQNVQLALRIAMIVGVPCSFGLIALAHPIMALLYPLQIESAQSATGCLIYLASGVIFIAVAQAMSGILQGLGKPSLSVYALIAGLLVKGVFTYVLTGMTELNVQGAAIGSSMGLAVVALLNLYYVKKETNIGFRYRQDVGKPLVCGLIMVIAVLACYFGISLIIESRLITLLAVVAGAVVYVVALIKLKVISHDEIKALPKGDLIEKILIKVKLI